ncbi:MAG: non-canonical purine NTP pyrophosphatase, partial [Gammaproteobacteria bacterium]|nr:non-canonical purine NTP pyrophosphatase [Gammaproteobacteria bacterium]
GVDSAQRGAAFICALAFVAHAQDPTPIVCTAQWRGFILEQPEGSNGFGYDPLFYVPEFSCSSASLDPATKNAHSHRGQAMCELQRQLEQQGWLA